MKKVLVALMLILSLSTALANAYANEDPAISLKITKTNWSSIGSKDGETIGSVSCNIDPFDHFEAEIRCSEDPDQFIPFSNIFSRQGNLVCYSFEGGNFPLNKDYHYTLTVKAFDVPYYGVQPKATETYSFVGTGEKAKEYADISITTNLEVNAQGLGYNMPSDGIIVVTFSSAVNNPKAWAALGMDGSHNLSVYSIGNEGRTWGIDISEYKDEEGGVDIHITAYDVATGNQIRGQDGEHSFAFAIFCSASTDTPTIPIEPTDPSDPSTPTTPTYYYKSYVSVNGNDYNLFESPFVSWDKFPEGSVVRFETDDPSIVKVSYEIVDITKNEVLKSLADLSLGSNGIWSVEAPKDYVCLDGHTYELKLYARNSNSAMITTNIVYSLFMTINGTTSTGPVLSNIKFSSIDPDTDKLLAGPTTVTVNFSEPPTTVEAWAARGMNTKVDLKTSKKGNSIQIDVPEEVMIGGTCSIFVRAKDSDGNIIGGGDQTVNPDNGYLNFEWMTTVGLPSPKLTEDGTIVDEIKTLNFTYSGGIGLNLNNNSGWKDIKIVDENGRIVMTGFTEDQFEVYGAFGVYTRITLNLKDAITKSGTYLVKLPYASFFLGEEYNAMLNGESTYSITIDEKPTLSNIIFLGINPSVETILKKETTVTVAFSRAPASVEAWCPKGQESIIKLDAKIEGRNAKINLTKEVMEGGVCSLFVRAKDAEGRIIGGGDQNVNPENGQLNFEWFTTIGLPAPKLVEDGSEVEEIKAINFTYEGIGLNFNVGAGWKNIEIVNSKGKTVVSNFAEEQFEGSGEGWDYTTMTLTLEESISESGTYTIRLPYASFFLGTGFDAMLNADAEYTIIIKEKQVGIETVDSDSEGNDVYYNLAGQRISNAKQNSVIIKNNKKIIYK